jgi:hypothetical protein
MIQENEILSAVLGTGVLHFIIIAYTELRKNSSIGLLVPAFGMLYSAWMFSIIEAFFWEPYMNYLEHIFYFFSALCLFIWTLRLPSPPEGSEK